MTDSQKTQDEQFKHLPYYIAGTGVAILLISLIFQVSGLFLLGIALGCFLATANFIFLTKIVVKLLNQHYTHKTFLILLIFAKLFLIVGVLVLAFKTLKVNVLSFGLGYLSFMPAVLIYQFSNMGPKPKDKN